MSRYKFMSLFDPTKIVGEVKVPEFDKKSAMPSGDECSFAVCNTNADCSGNGMCYTENACKKDTRSDNKTYSDVLPDSNNTIPRP